MIRNNFIIDTGWHSSKFDFYSVTRTLLLYEILCVINVNVRLFGSLCFSLHLLCRCTVTVMTEIEQEEAKLGKWNFRAALHVSSKKRKGTWRTLVEENSFPRQRSYERVTARSAECWSWMPTGRKVARKTSYCNYWPQHALLWGYEFNHCRSANFTETQKPKRSPFEDKTNTSRCKCYRRVLIWQIRSKKKTEANSGQNTTL